MRSLHNGMGFLIGYTLLIAAVCSPLIIGGVAIEWILIHEAGATAEMMREISWSIWLPFGVANFLFCGWIWPGIGHVLTPIIMTAVYLISYATF